MATTTTKLEGKTVVSPAEFLAARKEFLKKEKEFTRLRDELARERRQLPWERVEKKYVFEGALGKETLADLFGDKSQLLVYHFMLGAGWPEGCKSCSYLADHFEGMIPHLRARDVSFMVISHAPCAEIAAFQKRMGWKFKWVSSAGTDFNFDYHVSFTPEEMAKKEVEYNFGKTEFGSEEGPGASAFYKDAAGNVFHTYSTYARGLDIFVGAYNWLDIAPKGRDEDGLAFTMAWVRHHDKYAEGEKVDPKAQFVSPKAASTPKCCEHEA
jgi:predicted dithiol-disulfide oxidoreductase (DUF899 family)